jgi:benzil reductase ((S)-benzoin forming)
MSSPADRFALVTGTSAGIGAAVAAQLVDRGWRVVGVARRPAGIEHALYTHVAVDLADLDGAIDAIETAIRPILSDRSCRRVGLVNNAAAGGLLGPLERIPPDTLQMLYAVNVVAPVRLMALAVELGHPAAALRIVNLSSGAAVHAFPGLAAYGSSKAALRMAGMILAAELDSPLRPGTPRPDAAIVSYEPGIVETAMQVNARSLSADEFPWVGIFHDFQSQGRLVPPERPAADIVALLESDGLPRFSERRLGSS